MKGLDNFEKGMIVGAICGIIGIFIGSLI